MLRPSSVPPPEIRALRQYTRQLLHLPQDRTRCWQRLEKTLEDSLCKLTSVISKLAGSVSALATIAGERGPEVLAGLALTKVQAPTARPALAREAGLTPPCCPRWPGWTRSRASARWPPSRSSPSSAAICPGS